MRLPRTYSFKQIKTHIAETISFLGLEEVMDNVVGNEEERGISGGQRKRVNIGMELVAEPSVLFLGITHSVFINHYYIIVSLHRFR